MASYSYRCGVADLKLESYLLHWGAEQTKDAGFRRALETDADEVDWSLQSHTDLRQSNCDRSVPPAQAPALETSTSFTHEAGSSLFAQSHDNVSEDLNPPTQPTFTQHATSTTSRNSSQQPVFTRHSARGSESHPSISSSGTAEVMAERQMRTKEAALYNQLRQLDIEENRLRLELEPLQTERINHTSGQDEEGEMVLKELRAKLNSADLNDGPIMLHQDLALTIVRSLSEKRNEMGPLNEEIRQLELRLFGTEHRKRMVQDQLHHIYAQFGPRDIAERSVEVTVGDDNNSYVSDENGSVRGDDEAGDLEEEGEYDPSRLPPKLIEFNETYQKMQQVHELLSYWERQELKLQDKKEQREQSRLHFTEHESVSLHLAKKDEEALEELRSKITELEAKLHGEMERVKALREECLEAGIDEEDLGQVEFFTDNGDEDENGENVGGAGHRQGEEDTDNMLHPESQGLDHDLERNKTQSLAVFQAYSQEDAEELQSLDYSVINSWLFTRLAGSVVEVRLLGSIVEFMGLPMLEETAQKVINFWNSDTTIVSSGDLSAFRMIDTWQDSAEEFFSERGYDKAILQQLSGIDLGNGGVMEVLSPRRE